MTRQFVTNGDGIVAAAATTASSDRDRRHPAASEGTTYG